MSLRISLANAFGKEVAKLLNIFYALNRHFVPFPFYPDKSFLSPPTETQRPVWWWHPTGLGACTHVIELGAVPGETYDPACSPLAANPSQDWHGGRGWRRRNRDMTKGMGVEGREKLWEHQNKVCPACGDGHSQLAWCLDCAKAQMCRNQLTSWFSETQCFKNSEGFLIYYFASLMNGHVCKLVQIPRMHHFKVLHFSWKTLHMQWRGNGATHDTLTHTYCIQTSALTIHCFPKDIRGSLLGFLKSDTVSSKSNFLVVTDIWFSFYWPVIQ